MLLYLQEQCLFHVSDFLGRFDDKAVGVSALPLIFFDSETCENWSEPCFRVAKREK